MEKIRLLEEALSMIKKEDSKPLDGNFDPIRNMKDLLPQVVEHLVMEATGMRDGVVLKSAAIALRPRCKHDILLYPKQMTGFYTNLSDIYSYIASKGEETPDMIRFIDQIRFYKRATGLIGRCSEDRQ